MTKHYKQEIQRFLDRELPEEVQQRVGEHLMNCKICRGLHDELLEGRRLAAKLEREDAPERVWNNLRAAVAGPDSPVPSRSIYLKPLLAFGAAVIAMVLFVPVYLILRPPAEESAKETRPVGASWKVEEVKGSPKITQGGNSLELAVGEVLETDAVSSARIAVADIGKVDVAPNSRVRLVNTSSKEHRLALDRGKLTAEITAPPRLFIVDTPSAAAVDLGCAYSLEVGEDGSSRLTVTSGYVALESEGRESFVPAGAFCETRKGKRMGTPYFTSASEQFRRSLEEFDYGKGGAAAVSAVISESRRRDTLTLWHLLYKVSEEQRLEIFARISQLAEIETGITADGVMRLDSKTMEGLKDELMPVWYEQPGWYK